MWLVVLDRLQRPFQLALGFRAFEYVIDDSVFERFVGGHVVIAVSIAFDVFVGFSGVLCDDVVEHIPDAEHLFGKDLDVGRLPLRPTEWLMHQNPRMRQRIALAFGASTQQHLRHRGSDADTVRGDVRLDVLHRVVNRHPRGDAPTRRVDVHEDIFRRVLARQKEQLRNDQRCDVIIDRRTDEDDPLFEEPRVNVVGSLAAAGLLDDDRDELTAWVERNKLHTFEAGQ